MHGVLLQLTEFVIAITEGLAVKSFDLVVDGFERACGNQLVVPGKKAFVTARKGFGKLLQRANRRTPEFWASWIQAARK